MVGALLRLRSVSITPQYPVVYDDNFTSVNINEKSGLCGVMGEANIITNSAPLSLLIPIGSPIAQLVIYNIFWETIMRESG